MRVRYRLRKDARDNGRTTKSVQEIHRRAQRQNAKRRALSRCRATIKSAEEEMPSGGAAANRYRREREDVTANDANGDARQPQASTPIENP
jgi:hypothetical protein